MTEEVLQLVLLYAGPVLRKKSGVDGEEQVSSTAKVYVKAVEEI